MKATKVVPKRGGKEVNGSGTNTDDVKNDHKAKRLLTVTGIFMAPQHMCEWKRTKDAERHHQAQENKR